MKKPLPLHKKIVMKVMAFINNEVQLPVMRWVARDELQPAASRHDNTVYVEGVDYITPLVLMAAQADCARTAEADPAGYQAVLNACMEAVRADGIKDPMVQMFGALIGKGCPPDEAMVRLCANFVHLGMYLERRLALSFEGEPTENEQ